MMSITLKYNKLLFTMLLVIYSMFGQSTTVLSQENKSALKAVSADDFEVIMTGIRDVEWDLYSDLSSLDSVAQAHITSLNDNGSWSDIDYASTSQTSWVPYSHLARLKVMVLAYTRPGSSLKDDTELYNDIVSALNHWYNEDPRSTNWWYQQIACPQKVGEILILMRAGVSQTPEILESDLLVRMAAIGGRPDQSGSQGSGANKIDIALHWIYRACLQKNTDNLSFGAEQAYYPLFLTTGEGLQYDFSYKQHGSQLYIGGYGSVFIDKLSKVALITHGTIYEMSDQKKQLLSKYVRETFLQTIRGQYFHYNVIGRGVAYPNNLKQANFADIIDRMKIIDPDNILEYDDGVNRLRGNNDASYNVVSRNRHYWNSDYTLHNRPGYAFDVRSVSVRTERNENGNGANLKGYFLSDGATCLVLNGNEYENIFPVWDWAMIPGVTAPHLTTIPKPAQWGTPGTSVFAGGVTDGLTGVSAYSYYDTYSNINTGARKSWFFFENEIVCLGAGIKSTNAASVYTTVNQCLWDGDVVADVDGTENTIASGSHNYSGNVSRVYHDKVGYIFPTNSNIGLSNQSQSGSWYSINSYQSNDPVNKDVFKLWIDHGVNPDNAQYQYVIVPNVNSSQELTDYSLSHIEIVANTDSIQVVRQVAEDRWYFVFFEPCSFTNNDFFIQVNKPCTFILDDVDQQEVSLLVSSPSQYDSEISIAAQFPALSEKKELVCTFPVFPDPYAGQTKAFFINEDTPTYYAPNDSYSTIPVVADAYVRDGAYASVNYGAETGLYVKEDNSGYKRETFVKFDMSSLDGSTIDKVFLELEVMRANTSIHVTQWIISYVDDDSWEESTICYNNKPDVKSDIITIPPATGGQVVDVDITDFVLNNIMNGDKVLSLKIRSTTRGDGKTDATFYSKEFAESEKAPRLKVLEDDNTGFDMPEIDFENVDAERIRVEVRDIAGRLLYVTNRKHLPELNLRQGVYIIVASFRHNGRVYQKSYKYSGKISPF